jgi:hypothetical protein
MIVSAREKVNRSNGRGDAAKFSDQPRFKKTGDIDQYDFASFMKILKDYDQYIAPDPDKDNRTRDEFLTQFVRREPNLMGILSSVVEIDTNRGWRLVGGRNQVLRYTDILHNFQAAEGLYGWRPAISATSRSFWNTDMGGLIEVGRQGNKGPVRGFYTVDPTAVALTGNNKYPLKYYPENEKPIFWTEEDYIRTASLPSAKQALAGLGYCAISRCIELAVMMCAVYEHDKEQLGARAPSGLLLLQGISQQQWADAMVIREGHLDGLDREFFGSVAVLASKNLTLDAKLIALSQLPKGFNFREWVDLIIFGYSVCFGYDASEFFPVQFGAMGRGTETEVQHEKATAKGRLAFALGLQEQLQYFLPDTLLFQFDVRDDKGDKIRAESQQAQVDVVTSMYESGLGNGMSLVSRPQALALLANYGILPASWVPLDLEIQTDKEGGTDIELDPDITEPQQLVPPTSDDDVAIEPVVDDTNTIESRYMRDVMLDDIAIYRAAERYPTEPIIQYSYPQNSVIILASSGDAILRRRIF